MSLYRFDNEHLFKLFIILNCFSIPNNTEKNEFSVTLCTHKTIIVLAYSYNGILFPFHSTDLPAGCLNVLSVFFQSIQFSSNLVFLFIILVNPPYQNIPMAQTIPNEPVSPNPVPPSYQVPFLFILSTNRVMPLKKMFFLHLLLYFPRIVITLFYSDMIENVMMVPMAYNMETINENSMRAALTELVKSKIFWGKGAVNQMTISNVTIVIS